MLCSHVIFHRPLVLENFFTNITRQHHGWVLHVLADNVASHVVLQGEEPVADGAHGLTPCSAYERIRV